MKKIKALSLSAIVLSFIGGPVSLWSVEININRSFTSREKPVVRVYGRTDSKIYFRVYKIDNPLQFFSNQKNAHTVTEKSVRRSSGGFSMVKSFTENFKWSMFAAARRYMKPGSRNEMLDFLGMKSYNYPFADNFPDRNLFAPLKYKQVKEFNYNPPGNHYWFGRNFVVEDLKTGVYLVEASQGRNIAFAPLVISDIGILTKEGENTRLVYAFNVLTGEPVKSGSVQVYDNAYAAETKKLLEKGSIKNGIYYRKGIAQDSKRSLYVAAMGDHYALSDLSFYGRNKSPEQYRHVFTTDRPVYRQGHTIHFKGILFKDHNGSYKPATGRHRLTIKRGNDTIYNKDITLNRYGSYSDKVILPENAALGYYRTDLKVNGASYYDGFYVEQYEKPVFQVKVSSAEKTVYFDEAMKFHIQANYYSGEAVPNAKVTYEIQRKKIRYPWWWGFDYSWYYQESYDYYNYRFVTSGSTQTDSKGHAVVTFKEKKKSDGYDYQYKLTAHVRGANRKTVDGNGTLNYVRSDYRLQLSQKRWYYSNDTPVDLQVTARDWQKNRPVASVELKGRVYHKRWNSNTKRYVEEYLKTERTKTDKTGTARFNFGTLDHGGTYVVRVTAEDSKKRKVEEHISFWYFKGDSYSSTDSENITILPDQTKYNPFDTAKLQLKVPSNRGKLLLVKETSEIVGYEILSYENGRAEYSMQIDEPLMPDVTVTAFSVSFDDKAKIYSGLKKIITPPAHKFLKIDIISDRETFRPGDRARFAVRVRDHKGKPVAAEFSLGVVDEAIYALRSDRHSDITRDIYKKTNSYIATDNSLYFRFYGYSKEVSLYSQILKRQDEMMTDFKDKKRDEPKVRENFKDTAYWQAHGKTDSSGMGAVEFTFPDNLTAWRFTVHALTTEGEVGSRIDRYIVKKDLAVRLTMPRFLREKDKALLGFVVSNNHKETVQPALKLDVKGLALNTQVPQTVSLKPGEEKRIDFQVTASQLPEKNAEITAMAKASIDSDAVKRQLPVLPYGLAREQSKTYTLKSDETSFSTSVSMPADARSAGARLRISYINGVLPAVSDSLEYLIGYPYGCVEQTLSRFVPLVHARDISRRLKMKLPVSDNEIKKYTEAGLKKLYEYQHSDGGWGWWANDDTDPYMTAYVLDSLKDAQKLGIEVRPYVIKRGELALKKMITHNLTQTRKAASEEALVYMQYVYSRLAKPDKTILKSWSTLISNSKNPYVLALVLQGSQNSGNSAMTQKAAAALMNTAKTTGSGIYFSSRKKDYRWYNDAEETTAHVLTVILKTANRNLFMQQAGKMVNWLLTQKKMNRWRNTRTTAKTVTALAEYALASGEKLQQAKVELSYAGRKRYLVYKPGETVTSDMQWLIDSPAGSSTLKVTRNTKGFFQLRTDYSYYSGEGRIEPKNTDYSLTRRYYKVVKTQENNRLVYKPAGNSVTGFKTGDLVLSVTTIKAPKGSRYLLLEDYLPAGFEVLRDQRTLRLGAPFNRYWYYGAAREQFDDRLAAARTYIYNGTWQVHTVMRAVYPGTYQTMPAIAGNMYYPETHANSSNTVLSISE